MKTFEIKITGSGTKNMIEIRLLEIVRNIQLTDDNELLSMSNTTPFYEDDILCAEIKENN